MHRAAVLASSLLALASLASCGPTQQPAKQPAAASEASVPAAETKAGPHAEFLAMLGPELEKADGTKVKTADALEGRSHVLIYFTASWCGPCRRFTPDLVKYANEHEKATDFTVILVGSDRSADEQQAYMEKSKMPFLAVPFGTDAVKKIKQTYAGSGIPNLLILDTDGKVLKGSYETDGRYSPENRGSYIGPQQVLTKFTQMRAEAEKAASTEAG